MDDIRLQINDPKFYRKIILELANVEMYLQPIYNNSLKNCRKSYQLRSLMAQQSIPMLIHFKENLAESTQNLNHSIATLKNLIQAMDDVLKDVDCVLE